MKHPIAIVIVTWNSAASIERCLASALAQAPSEIVVVDNGSEDETVAIVQKAAPCAALICQGTNTGFAAGTNAGITESIAPFVLTLNSDAELGRGYAEILLRAMGATPQAASATGKLICCQANKRHIDSAGITMRRYGLAPLDRGHGEPDIGQYDHPTKVFGCSAAAALYRRAALNQIGPEYFDEDLFSYYEDVDLAWRLNRRGWCHLYEPQAVANHQRTGPLAQPGDIAGQAFANRYLVWLKNESLLRFALYAPSALAWESARLARRLLTKPELLAGIPTACRLAPRILRKRLRG